MFSFVGRIVSQRPWWVIGTWVVAATAIILSAPSLSSTQDESAFLPSHYESIQAARLQQQAFPQAGAIGALIVFDRNDGLPLTEADQATIGSIISTVGGEQYDTFAAITAGPVSSNGLVQAAFVTMREGKNPYDPAAMADATTLRDALAPLVSDTDLRVGVGGTAAAALDNQDAADSALVIVGAATIFLILFLLTLIFRSALISLTPILVVALVSQIAIGLIAWANDAFGLKTDSSIEVILLVVLYGIGTDYILFFLFRYRERLRDGESSRSAVAHAVSRAGEAIASAGGAVIVAFMALVFSSLSIFQSIGPALAIAVAVTVLAALTLVPAVVSVLGTRIFWPSKSWRRSPEATRFRRIGESLGRRPAVFTAASAGVLVVLAVFALGFRPTFDLSDTGAPSGAESTKALETFKKGEPSGAADPTSVLLHSTGDAPIPKAALDSYVQDLSGAPGVGTARLAATSPDGTTAMVSVILTDDPASDAAMANVKGPIRDLAHGAAPPGTEAWVGGTTSVYVDLRDAMNRDYAVVFSVAALMIMLILALLLRSLVAPVYLMVSVGLGFAATLGAAVLVVQTIGGSDGLVFMLPMYIYLFVVALGTDYNILMVARLREESRLGMAARSAAAKAVEHAGPTVAAAGVILAGTFASLMLGGNTLLVSMGFAISFGIVVAAFVMATFLTPSLTALLGHAAWWPGHGDATRTTVPAATDDAG